MKVKVSFTIDINAEAWANEFGLDKSEVRKDVQDYLARIAHDYAMYNLGLTTQAPL
jgi:hypothetical protein